LRPALSLCSICFPFLEQVVPITGVLPHQWSVYSCRPALTINNRTDYLSNMQEEIAYEEGYRDGLRFIFTLNPHTEELAKEIWRAFAEEISKSQDHLKELKERVA